MWNEIVATTSPTFDAFASLCKAHILQIKTLDFSTGLLNDGDSSCITLVTRAFCYAAAAAPPARPFLIRLLNSLKDTLTELAVNPTHRCTWAALDLQTERFLIPLATRLDLFWWLESLFSSGYSVTSADGHSAPCLLYAMGLTPLVDSTRIPQKLGHWSLNKLSFASAKVLLDCGADVYWTNDRFPHTSPWEHARKEASAACKILSRSKFGDLGYEVRVRDVENWMDIIELMGEHGADLQEFAANFRIESCAQMQNQHPAQALRIRRLLGISGEWTSQKPRGNLRKHFHGKSESAERQKRQRLFNTVL